MTIINGASKGTGFITWNNFTFGDLSVSLPNSSQVSALGIYLTTGQTVDMKILRKVTSSSFETVASKSFTHPGGGFADVNLDTPFDIPATGDYHMGVHVAGSPVDQSVPAARASQPDNISGTSGYTVLGSAAMPVLRANTDAVVEDPEDPPVDPPASSEYFYLFAGQSNGVALFNSAKQAFLDKLDIQVPGVTHSAINACFISSFIRQDGSNPNHWQPGSTLCNNAISLRDAAIASGKTFAGLIWYQGEAQTRAGREETIVNYADYFRNTLGVISKPGVPVLVVELHEQPDASFPLWPDMQFMQRQLGEKGIYGIDEVTVVSAAHLNGSYDGGLHLLDSELVILANDLGDTMASKIWPR